MSESSNLQYDANKLNALYQKLNTYVDNDDQNRQNIKLLMDSYYQYDDTNTYKLNLLNTNQNTDVNLTQKQNELNTIENNNITNQFKELENIKYNIINKNSLIENTYSVLEETNIQINILSTILFFSFLFLIVIYLYGSKTISATVLLIAFIFILIIYGLLLLYYFNIGSFRLFVYNFYNVKAIKFDNQLKEWVDKMDNDLLSLKSDWANDNCNCPKDILQKQEEAEKQKYLRKKISLQVGEEDYISKYNTIQNTNYTYFDDSAPPQTVYPFPQEEMGNQIEWVDYDTTDNSNSYYGNENTNMPRSALSNNITYTKYM